MNIIVRELRADHQNMASLLDLLRNLLKSITTGRGEEKESVSLVRQALEYASTYPVTVHRRKEELLFTHLIAIDPAMEETVAGLFDDHRTLNSLSQSLHAEVIAMERQEIVDLRQFADRSRQYIDRQRRHMRLEELKVFPVLEQRLGLADWKHVVSQAPASPDPLFQATGDPRYRHLQTHLQVLAGHDQH